MPYRISPSRIARFYYLAGCERFLKYSATPEIERRKEGIPIIEDEAGHIAGKLLEAGFAWEDKVVRTILGDKAIIAEGGIHDVSATMVALQKMQDGQYLYQPTLEAPETFYVQFGLDRELIHFSRCRPDLILCQKDESGRPTFKIIDIKASTDVKPSYKIQVASYALILRSVLTAAEIDGDVDTKTGGVWSFNAEQPEWFDLSQPLDALKTFFREQLTAILRKPMKDIFWHTGVRCEWCGYFGFCKEEAERTKSVSLIPRISSHARRFLNENLEKPVETLTDLKIALSDPAQAIALNSCGSLRGKQDRLMNHVMAFESGEAIPHGGSTPMMPRFEHIRIVMTFESDPLQGWLYAAGYLRVGGEEVFGNGEREEVFVARTPEMTSDILTSFINTLHRELASVHDYNEEREWKFRRSLQCFVFDHFERWIFSDLLFDAVKNSAMAMEAVRLLDHFQSADLFTADSHPSDEKSYPLVILSSVVNELLALPFPFFTKLKDVAEVLQHPTKKFSYEPRDELSFQLSNRIRGDVILNVWEEKRTDLLEMIRDEVHQRLHVANGIIDGIRYHFGRRLFAWPERFLFSSKWNLNNPELSKLAFAVSYESLMNAVGTRAMRSKPWAERLRDEISIPLKYIGGNHWKLESPITGENIGEDGFGSFLLVPAGFKGDQVQMGFNDLFYRNKVWGAKGLIRYAGIEQIHRDLTGMMVAMDLSIYRGKGQQPFQVGDRTALSPRAVDFLSGRLIHRLQEIDEEPESEFLQLLRNPQLRSHSKKWETSATQITRSYLKASKLTSSQKKVVRHFLKNELAIVWGPPGSGKTFCIASAILIMAAAHSASGQTVSIGITSLAHAGIENALMKVDQLIPQFGLENEVGLYKLDGIHLMKAESLQVAPARKAFELEGRHKILIVGATSYALEKAIRGGMQPFDVLVIDEASQVQLPELALAMMAKKQGGRILVAGDDCQLQPISGVDFPKPENGDPWLLDSVFSFLRSKDTTRKPHTIQLTENFRMNSTLTKFPAMNLYGPRYRPATRRIAQRTLRLKPKGKGAPLTDEEEFSNWILDPQWPMVIITLENTQAAAENPLEAQIVALLVDSLRRRLFMENSRRLYPATAEGDKLFWSKGLFVLSPHHAQLRAIRRALAKRRNWFAPPFVGTVERLQGQEADCVIASYAVADIESVVFESKFLFGFRRLNVSITRAKSKCVLCLPRQLLVPHVDLSDDEEIMKGITFMRNLEKFCREHGQVRTFGLDFIGHIGAGKRLTAIRARYCEDKSV